VAAVEASFAAKVATLEAGLRTSTEDAAAKEASTTAAAAAALASHNAAMQHVVQDKNTRLAQLQAGTASSSSSCILTHPTPPHHTRHTARTKLATPRHRHPIRSKPASRWHPLTWRALREYDVDTATTPPEYPLGTPLGHTPLELCYLRTPWHQQHSPLVL